MALSYATRLHSCCHCRNDLPLVSSGLCVACAALLQWCSYHGEAEKLRAFYDKTYPASPKAISIAPDPFKCLSCREPKALYISGFCPDCTPRIASDVHKGDGEKTLEAFYCVTYPYRPEITRRTAPDPSICFLKDCYTRRSGAFYCPGCAARLASYVIAGDKGSIAAFYRTTDRYGLSRSSTAGESHPDRGNAQCIPYGGPRRELPEGVFQFSREPVRAEGSGGHGVSRQALEPNGRSEVERVPAVLDDLVDEVLPPTTRRAGRSERRGHTMEPSGRSRAERLPAVLEDRDDEVLPPTTRRAGRSERRGHTMEPSGRSRAERLPAVLEDRDDEVLPPTTRRAGRSERVELRVSRWRHGVERLPAVLEDRDDEVLPPTTRRTGRSEREGHTMELSSRSRAERGPAVQDDLDDEDDSSTYGDAWEDCVSTYGDAWEDCVSTYGDAWEDCV